MPKIGLEEENKEQELPRCHDLGTHKVNCFDNNCGRDCGCCGVMQSEEICDTEPDFDRLS